MRFLRSVNSEHVLGDAEVSSVRDVVWRRVVMVMSAVAVVAETMEVLHSQIKILKKIQNIIREKYSPATDHKLFSLIPVANLHGKILDAPPPSRANFHFHAVFQENLAQ